jgi:hypothetical protein
LGTIRGQFRPSAIVTTLKSKIHFNRSPVLRSGQSTTVYSVHIFLSLKTEIKLLDFIFVLALQPPWALDSDFQFHDYFTDGRTPWTSDQLVARPLANHRTTQTQNKRIHTPNIPCLVWDSNPRSLLPSERRQFMP